MNLLRAIVAVLAACLVAHAHAHAFLDRSEPRVGATVHVAPAELKLWFSEEVEPAFTTVKVFDAKGKRVDKADARVDLADRGLLRVSLDALGPGVYNVVWRAVSVDTHVTEGDFVFHVGQ
jgi:hypothetical protein